METPEVFLKNRNYGCRIKKYISEGLEYVALENELIRVEICTGKGADLTSYLYKPMDIDLMLHGPNDRKNITEQVTKAGPGGSFFDGYGGGWQELFPTYGGATEYYGAQIGIHGEACVYPWETEITEDTPDRIVVSLTLDLRRSPFRLKREYTMKSGCPKLELRQSVTNTGTREYFYMWGHHPALGFPFLDENVRIRLRGTPKVTVPKEVAGTDDCPFDKGTEGYWPVIKDRNGKDFRLDRAYAAKDRMRAEYVISEMEEGRIDIVNEKKGLGFRMKYDCNVFKYVWIWGLYCGGPNYPWYGRTYTMGVEPQSTSPANFKAAQEAGVLPKIGPGETVSTYFDTEVFTE